MHQLKIPITNFASHAPRNYPTQPDHEPLSVVNIDVLTGMAFSRKRHRSVSRQVAKSRGVCAQPVFHTLL